MINNKFNNTRMSVCYNLQYTFYIKYDPYGFSGLTVLFCDSILL